MPCLQTSAPPAPPPPPPPFPIPSTGSPFPTKATIPPPPPRPPPRPRRPRHPAPPPPPPPPGITADPHIIVVPQSDHSFQAGFALYQSRPDKQYSLTDCISMETMRQQGITDILTHDNNFTQEGFTALL